MERNVSSSVAELGKVVREEGKRVEVEYCWEYMWYSLRISKLKSTRICLKDEDKFCTGDESWIRERSDSVDRRGVQHLVRSSDLLLRLFHWSSQGKKRVTQGKESEHSLISRASRNVSQSSIVIHAKHAASKAAVVSKKLLRSTGKAAWISGTTFLILAVPLIIKMDRDQQLTEIELQNASLLGTAPTPK
ncbi:hypothetical protein RGQ29_019756 [Quercus rubra]|uniref:Uncharacterized protein n=1 Tax=Quercus rubra TaxID=3512 RepID=A0AAN7F8W9_QUERU|nr:hypothetical protein RGQ29_019756 [Quercus rubra]